MQTAGPVAMVQPRPDLDSIAYGQPYAAPRPVVVADGGGAISALRNSFASGPEPMPVAYAAPMGGPVRYDASYHLDAGDKLRVVVYGQEGLTNSYAIDAGGSITMPLIGAVPARGRTTAGLAGEIAARLRNGYIREPSVVHGGEEISHVEDADDVVERLPVDGVARVRRVEHGREGLSAIRAVNLDGSTAPCRCCRAAR